MNLSPDQVRYMYFSQTGEDILAWMYMAKPNGFFVDVGAYNPIDYSNTFALYLRGWRGINIEPNPEVINAFNFSTANTFKKELAANFLKNDSQARLAVPTQKIQTRPLRDILDEYYPHDRYFDLLTVDVEGMDLEVLESSNWEKYRPELVLVEDHDFDMENPAASLIFQFMKEQNYTLVSKTISSLVFHKTEAFRKRPGYAGKAVNDVTQKLESTS